MTHSSFSSLPLLSVVELCWDAKSVCLRVTVLCVGGAGLVWARFAVMTTGAPQFKPIDNPASFSESFITRVSSLFTHTHTPHTHAHTHARTHTADSHEQLHLLPELVVDAPPMVAVFRLVHGLCASSPQPGRSESHSCGSVLGGAGWSCRVEPLPCTHERRQVNSELTVAVSSLNTHYPKQYYTAKMYLCMMT